MELINADAKDAAIGDIFLVALLLTTDTDD